MIRLNLNLRKICAAAVILTVVLLSPGCLIADYGHTGLEGYGDFTAKSSDSNSDGILDESNATVWFQLSPDDSTSMATAQILKLQNFYRFYHTLYPHEVINYYDPPQSYRQDNDFSKHWLTEESYYIGLDAANAQENHMELLIHVYAPQVGESDRKPWNLHLCIDVSGSMHGSRIEFTKNALNMLVNAMKDDDRLSITTFERTGRLVLESTEVSSGRTQILSAINSLRASGGTNMKAGLDIVYQQAIDNYDPAMVNRVILFSDGDANVGITDYEAIADQTRKNNQEGIYLSGVGVGSNYAMGRMDALTDAGKGAHVFLPDAGEVETVFGPMLRKLIDVAADEISVEVELPSRFSLVHFSGEEVSTDPEERVQNIVLAAGDDLTILCIFEDETGELDTEGDLVFTFRYQPLSTREEKTFQQTVSLKDLIRDEPGALMNRTRLVHAYGIAAIEHMMGDDSSMDDIQGTLEALLQQVETFTPQDPGLEEIANELRRRIAM